MLSILATPIGNLGDITLRAIDVLRHCDLIVCEDTRVTGSLLKALDLPKKELFSFHGHSNPRKIDGVIERLRRGDRVALTSDAGTPGISDPGFHLVARVRAERLPIEVVPGPSAFLAALSASGLPINRFMYLGFLPLKKGRQTLLACLAEREETVVFYESVHRIERTLLDVARALAGQPDRPVVIARELTKMHEEVVSTTVAALPDVAASMTKKGEFVVVVGPK